MVIQRDWQISMPADVHRRVRTMLNARTIECVAVVVIGRTDERMLEIFGRS